jgi:hypothetical protein
LENPIIAVYFVFQSTFMESQQPSLETLQDIKRMMERSSRFISLSGLSGISAGLFALAGAYVAKDWIGQYANLDEGRVVNAPSPELRWKLILLAGLVLVLALIASLYFTWRKAKKNSLPVWDHSSKKLLINLLIPLITGGLFISGLLYYNHWELVSPACLVFYGLALVNASKYTLTDIRYMGLIEIGLGWVGMFYSGYGLYFWAIGFGLVHIVYGAIMWLKYEWK